MYKIAIFCFATLIILSCSPEEQGNKTYFNKNIKVHEIRRVREVEIIKSLSILGTEVFESLAIMECDVAKQKIDSLRRKYGFEMEALDISNFEDIPLKEKEVMEALAFSIGQNQTISPTPQKLSDLNYAYYFSLDTSCFNDSLIEKGVWKISFDKSRLIQALAY